MSTSWSWFPDMKTATCCYCGFTTTYADDFPGHVEHDCDPALHSTTGTPQGLPVGRSPRPDAANRVSLDKLLACIHRGPELRQEPCPTCPAGTRIKIFPCAIHRECTIVEVLEGMQSCEKCTDFIAVDPH